MWYISDIVIYELTQQQRQQDEEFACILNELRKGDKRQLQYLVDKTSERFRAQQGFQSAAQIHANEAAIKPHLDHKLHLYPLNNKVDALNMKELSKLSTETVKILAVDYVRTFQDDATDRSFLRKQFNDVQNFRSLKGIQLKVGAKVLSLINCDKNVCNGSCGTIVRFAAKEEAQQSLKDRISHLCDLLDEAQSFQHDKFVFADDNYTGTIGESFFSFLPKYELEISEPLRRRMNTSIQVQRMEEIAVLRAWESFDNLQFPVVQFLKHGIEHERIMLPSMFKIEIAGRGLCFRMQVPLILGWAGIISRYFLFYVL
jgi:hypothetical protein